MRGALVLPIALRVIADSADDDVVFLGGAVGEQYVRSGAGRENYQLPDYFSLPDTVMNGGLRPLRNPTSAWDF